MAIAWKPFSDKSLDFIKNSTARLNIAYGAVRSSKTVSCLVRWLQYIVQGPPGDLAMLSKTTATLQRNMLNDMQDTVGPNNFKWINRQTGELRIFNRRIWTFGANNEDAESKLRGATFAGALCDEVTLYPQSVFMQLIARCSVEDSIILANTNPDNPYHWFNQDFILNERIEDKRIWHFTLEDNPSLSPSYIESLKQTYRGVWYDRMVRGLWVAAEGRIYDMFDDSEHVIETEPAEKAHSYFVSCDYGTSTVMTWGLFGEYAYGKTVKLKEYYYDAQKEKSQKSDYAFGNEFDSWIQSMNIYPDTVYVDPAAASWKVELSSRGYYVQNADNDVINGIRYVGAQLSLGNYHITRQCENTIREYHEYVWDKDAQLKGQDKPVKQHDHTCDTDRYALYTRSKFALSGVYPSTRTGRTEYAPRPELVRAR